MKNYYFKLVAILSISFFLSACLSGRANQAELNYAKNYGGYLANQTDCFKYNKHKASFKPEGATEPVELEFSAGDCHGVEKPQHGGEYVAQTESAMILAGGQIISAGITSLVNYEISESNNETRVDIARLQNEREAAENAVLIEAISAREDQTTALANLAIAVTEQNSAVTDLVLALTAEEEPPADDGGTGSGSDTGGGSGADAS